MKTESLIKKHKILDKYQLVNDEQRFLNAEIKQNQNKLELIEEKINSFDSCPLCERGFIR